METVEIESEVQAGDLARFFGGTQWDRVSWSTRAKVEELQERFHELINPSLCYVDEQIAEIDRGTVHLHDGTSFASPKLSKTLKGCEELICFLGTIGHKVDRAVQDLLDENRLSEAYILDAMASLAAENMVERFHQDMKTRYEEQGKHVTLRFSPGYCDWPLVDQKKLFDLLDSDQLDIQLTDSCFMRPRKSVSGVFGVMHADGNGADHPYNPCLECQKRECPARRV
jgi:hypothetical protein